MRPRSIVADGASTLMLVFSMLYLLPSAGFGQMDLVRFGQLVKRDGFHIDMYVEKPRTLCVNNSWVFKLKVVSKPVVFEEWLCLVWKFKTVDCNGYIVENKFSVDLHQLNNGMNERYDWVFDGRSLEEEIYDVSLQTKFEGHSTTRVARLGKWIPMQDVVHSMNDLQSDSVKMMQLSERIGSERSAIEIEMEKMGYVTSKDPFETTQSYQRRISSLKSARDSLEAERLLPLAREFQVLSSRLYSDLPDPKARISLDIERYDADRSIWTMGFYNGSRLLDVCLKINPDAAKRLWLERGGISVHRVRDIKAVKADVMEVRYGAGGTYSFLLVKSDIVDKGEAWLLDGDMFFGSKGEVRKHMRSGSVDSTRYAQTTIGSQIWMANNLNVGKFRNGDLIPEARSADEWRQANRNREPAWCYYQYW